MPIIFDSTITNIVNWLYHNDLCFTNHIFRMFFRVKITFFGCFSGQKSHFPKFSRGEEDAITSQLNPKR